jgi:hypothetical protein
MKREVIHQNRKTFFTSHGYTVRIIMKLYKYARPTLKEYPQGYKFSLIALNVDRPQQELVLVDNHHGKAPHYHIDEDKKGQFFS